MRQREIKIKFSKPVNDFVRKGVHRSPVTRTATARSAVQAIHHLLTGIVPASGASDTHSSTEALPSATNCTILAAVAGDTATVMICNGCGCVPDPSLLDSTMRCPCPDCTATTGAEGHIAAMKSAPDKVAKNAAVNALLKAVGR